MSLKSLIGKVAVALVKPAAEKAKTSKHPALTLIGGTFKTTSNVVKVGGTALAAGGLLTAYFPAVALSVAKAAAPTALTIGTISLLAPKTTKAVLSSPESSKTAAAALINPYAGLVVGLEQGGGLLSESWKGFSDTTKGLIAGGGGLIAGTALALGVSDLLHPTEGATAGNMLDNAIKKITGKEKEIIETTDNKISTGNEGVVIPQGTPAAMKNADVITPQTVDITKKTYKKKRSKAPQQQINQLVKISINNQNKKYLKMVAH